MNNFRDQTVVVAGISSSLTHELVAAYRSDGAQVFVLGTNLHTDSMDTGVQVITVDLLDATAVSDSIQQIAAKTGKIDALITNMLLPMPIDAYRPAAELTPERWDADQIEFQNSVFYANVAVAKIMLGQRSGNIVNLGPVDGLFAQQRVSSYAAAAASVFMLSKALAVEWASAGLRVNAIACGVMPRQDLEPLSDQAYLSRIPIGRRGKYREFIEAALFLTSDDASFVTGEVLRVDGGWTAYHLFYPFENAF